MRRRLPVSLRLLLGIVLTGALAAALLTAADPLRMRLFEKRARNVKIGDTREQVRAIMGSPTDVFEPPEKPPVGWYLGVRVETWAYGRLLNWQDCFLDEFPWFFPFRFRIFGPDSDDIEIEFDSSGRVAEISLPDQ